MKQFVNFRSNQHQIKSMSWTVSALHNPPQASDKVCQLIRSEETEHRSKCEQVISKLILQEQLENGTNVGFCVSSRVKAEQTLYRLKLCPQQKHVGVCSLPQCAACCVYKEFRG